MLLLLNIFMIRVVWFFVDEDGDFFYWEYVSMHKQLLVSIFLGLSSFLFPVPWLHSHPSCQSLPVVLLHGINSNKRSMVPLEENLHRVCPNLRVFNIEIGDGNRDSFRNLWKQLEMFRQQIIREPELKEGFHLIAHSQGGVTARGYVESYNKDSSSGFHVHTLITLGSPHRGVDGIPYLPNNSSIIEWVDDEIKDIAYGVHVCIKVANLYINSEHCRTDHPTSRTGLYQGFPYLESEYQISKTIRKPVILSPQ